MNTIYHTRLIYRILGVVLLLGGSVWSCNQKQAGDQPETLKIAVVPKMTTHTFFQTIHAGAKQAAEDLEVEIDWQGPQKENDRQQQISIVQNFISRKMDAIVLAPSDSRSMVQVVRNAQKAAIPVVIYDSDLDSKDYVSFVATDNYKGGQLCADRLAEIMKGNRIIMLRQTEGSASTTAREQGFLDRIQEVKPEVELLSTNQYGGTTLEKALQVSQNLLNRFEQIDGIFCPSEPTTQAMLRALQIAGKTAQVKFVGFDFNEVLLEGLRQGEIDGLAVQDPFNMGYLGVKTAVQHIRGESIEKRIDTGVHMVTQENMEAPAIRKVLYPQER